MPKHPQHATRPEKSEERKQRINRFAQSLTVRRMFSLLDYPGILSQLSPGVNRNLHIFPAKVPGGHMLPARYKLYAAGA